MQHLSPHQFMTKYLSLKLLCFLQNLEMHMRAENPPLAGRDHLSYRSYYFPVKNVLDGDLCEQYNTLDPAKQKSISEELDRTPAEVSKKLEDIRTRYAF